MLAPSIPRDALDFLRMQFRKAQMPLRSGSEGGLRCRPRRRSLSRWHSRLSGRRQQHHKKIRLGFGVLGSKGYIFGPE
jgi:hypothetical protein